MRAAITASHVMAIIMQRRKKTRALARAPASRIVKGVKRASNSADNHRGRTINPGKWEYPAITGR